MAIIALTWLPVEGNGLCWGGLSLHLADTRHASTILEDSKYIFTLYVASRRVSRRPSGIVLKGLARKRQ
jgi:hypothetical protein